MPEETDFVQKRAENARLGNARMLVISLTLFSCNRTEKTSLLKKSGAFLLLFLLCLIIILSHKLESTLFSHKLTRKCVLTTEKVSPDSKFNAHIRNITLRKEEKSYHFS